MSITCGIQEIKQERSFITLLNPNHFLGNVLRGGAHTAHSQEDVIFQEITCQYLNKQAKIGQSPKPHPPKKNKNLI